MSLRLLHILLWISHVLAIPGCEPWCSAKCSELNGDLAYECGKCGLDSNCNPRAADYRSSHVSQPLEALDTPARRTIYGEHKFHGCPVLDDVSSLWETMSRDPRPRVIRQAISEVIDFAKQFARHDQRVGMNVDLVEFQISPSRPYVLSAAGYSPEIIAQVSKAYPLPPAVSSVQQRPVISVGLKGSGERDLAHHYHPITALKLLEGEKIWALRPPRDEECAMNAADCTDPLNVCDYYFGLNAPAPACVQRPGDTIIVPNGWFHGTCNNASLTVAWGGQGQTFGLEMHGSDENDKDQPLFGFRLGTPAPGSAPTFGESEMMGMREALTTSSWQRAAGHVVTANLLRAGAAFQAPLMTVRSLWGEFLSYTQEQSERHAMEHLQSMECSAIRLSPGVAASLERASPDVWAKMRRWTHAHLLVGLEDSAVSLAFLRHKESRATRAIHLAVGDVAMWMGAALSGLEVVGSTAQTLLWCSAKLLLPHGQAVERAWNAERRTGGSTADERLRGEL